MTPRLLLDKSRVARNCQRMAGLATAHGLTLRPHLKTAKCVEVAALAVGEGGPITVSTVAEAAFFAERGYADMTLAVCVTREAATKAADLQEARGVCIGMLIDSHEALDAMLEVAANYARPLRFFVEIDSGEHRSGLAPDDVRVVELASRLDESTDCSFAGVLTHGGHAYNARDADELQAIAEQERLAVCEAAQRVREDGIDVPCVSAGSTPTILSAARWDGLTEIRPGCYTLFDLTQHALGVCDLAEIAIAVEATVISRNLRHGRVIIDAGALALSKDRGAGDRRAQTGYGLICDSSWRPIANLHLATLDQEHGYVEGDDDALARLRIGDRVIVLPGHACITAACHPGFQVVQDATEVGYWKRAAGW